MHTKALSWLRRGNRIVRMTKVISIAFLLYWLIQFVSTSFKVAEGFVAIGIYVGFLLWLKHQRVVNLRLSGMDEIDQMTDEDFEQRMLVFFHDFGFKATATKNTGDFGADLVLTRPDGMKIAARCKCQKAPVGLDAVQEVIAATRYYHADAAMVITNGSLTRNAKELARVNDVEVWERDDLAKQLASMVDWSPPLLKRVKIMLTDMFRRTS